MVEKETYQEIRSDVGFDFITRILALKKKKRYGLLHVTGLVDDCNRKAYYSILKKYQTPAIGARYVENFFGGEAVHQYLDHYAPTIAECAKAMAQKYGVAEEEWRKIIEPVYGTDGNNRMGELPLAYDVLNDKSVDIWDSETGGLTEKAMVDISNSDWFGILIGEVDSVLPFLSKKGEPALCIVDNKTTMITPDNSFNKRTMWDNQKKQLEIYRYLISKNGMGSPSFGVIRQLNYYDKFMKDKMFVEKLSEPSEIEDQLKSKMKELEIGYLEGKLPMPTYGSLCGYCPYASACMDNKPEEANQDLVLVK